MSEAIEKTKIQIKSIFGKILFESEKTTIKEAVIGANLRGANLRGANLRGANLRGANLGEANLRGANLEGANLRGANLEGAKLEEANLGEANLGGANLGEANLEGANLRGANLRGANLRGANLEGAKNIVSITTNYWTIFVTKSHIKIGCQYHEYEKWMNFSDEEIGEMSSSAVEFWAKYKPLIIAAWNTL